MGCHKHVPRSKWTDRKEARCQDMRVFDLKAVREELAVEVRNYMEAENMIILNKMITEVEL